MYFSGCLVWERAGRPENLGEPTCEKKEKQSTIFVDVYVGNKSGRYCKTIDFQIVFTRIFVRFMFILNSNAFRFLIEESLPKERCLEDVA